MKRWTLPLTMVMAMFAFPLAASAAELVPIAPSPEWDSTPIAAASPPGDSRLFVVERAGGVRIVEGGALLPTPFLTVPNVDTDGERGLLSIAFAPDYSASGLFYVFTVAAGPDTLDPSGATGDLRVVEYHRSLSGPDLADPTSARLVLKQAHGGATNHNGGQVAFGPEGLLYVTMGDAGNSANAQSLSNDLGKVLRIDPREQSGGAPFGVPNSNPFVSTAGAKPEIYTLGLRNPYRASFGPGGELVLPDVGQSTWEEVNVGWATGTPAATTLAGANMGWPECEGECTPPNPLYADPIFQYPHAGPAATSGCAIIGGYVIRDPTLTGLTGRYLYGDLCRSDLRTLDLSAAGADPCPAGLSLPAEAGALLGFGEDGLGHAYVITEATVYRVAASSTAPAACSTQALPTSTSAGDSTVAPDITPLTLSLSAPHRQRLRRVLRVFAICDEACALRGSGVLGLAGATAPVSPVTTGSGEPGQRVRVPIELARTDYRRARRALKQGLKAAARATVTATDRNGNSAQQAVRVALAPPLR